MADRMRERERLFERTTEQREDMELEMGLAEDIPGERRIRQLMEERERKRAKKVAEEMKKVIEVAGIRLERFMVLHGGY
jgi:hypothetical protein